MKHIIAGTYSFWKHIYLIVIDYIVLLFFNCHNFNTIWSNCFVVQCFDTHKNFKHINISNLTDSFRTGL